MRFVAIIENITLGDRRSSRRGLDDGRRVRRKRKRKGKVR